MTTFYSLPYKVGKDEDTWVFFLYVMGNCVQKFYSLLNVLHI